MASVAQGFEPLAESVGAARRYAVSALEYASAQRLQDEVRTVVSELATNAVLHAQTAFTVSVTLADRTVRVAVTDGSTTRPRPSRLRDQQASTGRGLYIVAELSAAWGVEADAEGNGKTIWCDLPLPADEVPADDGTADEVPADDGTADDGTADEGTADGELDLDALLARYADPGDPAGPPAAQGPG